MYPEIILAQQIILACKAKQISRIVLSPGSRNAPLTLGFSSDDFFTCYSIVDERCAAFFALGMAQQLAQPVAVVCTSGSALLNYAPAVSEAFYSHIPLVVISADRPTNKVDIADGQTIRQTHVLANHTAYNANLSDAQNQQKFNQYELNSALNACIEQQRPVHINAPFEEPLYRTTNQIISFENQPIAPKNSKISLQNSLTQQFIRHWNASSKKMIVAGVLPPHSIEKKWLDLWAQDPSILVLTETTSNLSHPAFISMIDTFLTPTENNETLGQSLQPDLLISVGGMVISKKIKQFLRKYKPQYHYSIDPHNGYDTFFALTAQIPTSVNTFFEEIATHITPKKSAYHSQWEAFYQDILTKRDLFLQEIPYADLWVYQQILQAIPKDYHLQISNSSAIRYAQLFPAQKTWEVFSNRGVSGIDGSTSTAIGAAQISPKPTLLITGDLSFFYDSNALWNAYTPKNFKIILINNNGGGIFRILPADTQNPNFETFFETPHNLTAKHLCQMYGWEYFSTSDKASFKHQIDLFLQEKNTPVILEVFTPRKENDKLLKKYFKALKT